MNKSCHSLLKCACVFPLLLMLQLEEQVSRLQREKNDLQSRMEEDQEDMNELMKKHKAAVAQVTCPKPQRAVRKSQFENYYCMNPPVSSGQTNCRKHRSVPKGTILVKETVSQTLKTPFIFFFLFHFSSDTVGYNLWRSDYHSVLFLCTCMERLWGLEDMFPSKHSVCSTVREMQSVLQLITWQLTCSTFIIDGAICWVFFFSEPIPIICNQADR